MNLFLYFYEYIKMVMIFFTLSFQFYFLSPFQYVHILEHKYNRNPYFAADIGEKEFLLVAFITTTFICEKSKILFIMRVL